MIKLARFHKALTRVSLTLGSSSCKITAPRSLTLLLEIAVNSITTVILHSVGVVTSPILKNWGAVSSSSTGIIQGFLKSLVTQPIFTHTIDSST